MVSLCVKTNNKNIIYYLLNNLSDINLNDIIYSQKHFKLYTNIIIHYKGENISQFYSNITNILTNCILCFYEQKTIHRLVNYNYFYFDNFEKRQIEENCQKALLLDENSEYNCRIDSLWTSTLKYITENKSILLDGFVNFRIAEYISYLDSAIDEAVNKFIIDKEYIEFINLLRIYINSKDSQIDMLHLIYMNGDSILLDEKNNIIPITDHSIQAQYLSDISFSSNDYALNTLLNLLPNKINIHLIDKEDEFINTLKLIFDNRVMICTDCNICRTYQLINKELAAHHQPQSIKH